MTPLDFEEIADELKRWLITDTDNAEDALACLIDAFSADDVLWASFQREVEEAIKEYDEHI